MKLIFRILPFAVVTTAFVVPDVKVMEQVAIEKKSQSYLDSVEPNWPGFDSQTAIESVQKPIRIAYSPKTKVTEAKAKCHQSTSKFDVLEYPTSSTKAHITFNIDESIPHRLRGKGKQMGDDTLPTIYQLLSTSENTQKFAKLIDQFPDLIELLNGTAANYTLFAPIDAGIHDDPEDKPSKEQVHKVLSYHISPLPYNAYSVFFARTISTTLEEEALGDYPQRLRVGFGLSGLHLNFKSKFLSTDNVRASSLSSPN